jgi:hypothetical protein
LFAHEHCLILGNAATERPYRIEVKELKAIIVHVFS